MDDGKDVYLEKPMCHTIDEARHVVQTVKETKRVLQVGSQTTSAAAMARGQEAIADGTIGKMIMSQGSYHRNSNDGEWNWPIDAGRRPGRQGRELHRLEDVAGQSAQAAFDADRFFRFRKYWDYSGGIATDLFFHVVAPLNICWAEPQFPSKVMATGGIYVFKDEREVPDTFHLMAEFPQGHSLVLSSTMANSRHIPGLIRGHEGTIVMVEHGQFERWTDHISLYPELRVVDDAYKTKFGSDPEIKIPIERKNEMVVHIENFLDCMHTREKPTLDADTGFHAQATISMAVQAYREGRVMYWDDKNQKAVPKPVKA